MGTPEGSENLIYQNVPFERRWMKFERFMWLLLVLILGAACFGVFGRGAYARHTVRSGPLSIQYDRIVRSRTQTDLVITLDPSVAHRGQVRLLLTGALLDKARLYDVMPKPSSEELLDKGMALTFKTVPGTSATVTLIQKVEGVGRIQSHLGLDNGSPIALDQFILP